MDYEHVFALYHCLFPRWQLAAPSYWADISGIMNGIYVSYMMMMINFNFQVIFRPYCSDLVSDCFSPYLFRSQNCVDAYPTFLAVLWSAGLLCSQVPAAFAGLMYLLVRQKYFVGYLGERTQSTPGYIFGKRIILFLFLMSVAGIFNYYLIFFFGSDFENYIKTVTTTISPLLLIP
uniref:Arachidonate 5-lipoxygenase-activating protein n=1 Tax=Macaca mulatta TaxID=9544 RepID=A0A5F7Z816_MACMU